MNPGDLFSGFSKSLSKKSEYFFSELEIQLSECDFRSGLISGIIDKRVISISGKKYLNRVYFEGEIIDGINHTFTSSLSANCEALDVYFWSRFPSFKDIDSLKDLKKIHSPKYVYMRWTERGSLKTKLSRKKKREESESDSDDLKTASKKHLSISSASSTVSEDDELALDSDAEEDEFELIEYFDANSNKV